MDSIIMSTPRIGDLGDALTFFIAKCDGDFRVCHLKSIYEEGEAICRTTKLRKKGSYRCTSEVRFKTLSHTNSTVYVVTVRTTVQTGGSDMTNQHPASDRVDRTNWYPCSRGYVFVPRFNNI